MKRFVTALALCLMGATAFTAKAQLNTMTTEEAHGYRTVYTAPMKYGEIRFIDGSYFLCGSTDNRFENSMASVFLGSDKESSVLTLEDLRKIVKKETPLKGEIVVKGLGKKNTTIFRNMGETIFKTDGIAGYTHVLWAMRNDFEKAKRAVMSFDEDL